MTSDKGAEKYNGKRPPEAPDREFQTPEGVRFDYALQNENLVLDKKSTGFAPDRAFRIIGAYYGNEKEYSSAMQKMEHYEYFK